MTETYYDVLGVDDDATTEEIRSAYRAKVKETHPDVSDAADAEERFKRITRAREVLTDADKRDRYDRLGHDQYVTLADGVVDGSQYTEPAPTEDGAGETNGTDRTTSTDTTASGSAGWRDHGSTRTDPGAATADWATGSNPGAEHSEGSSEWQQSTQRSDQREASGYATRTTYTSQSFDRVRLPLTPQTAIQIGAMFVLYPVFLLASFFPLFPTVVNVLVGLCTLFVVAYLLSIPEVAIVVFGAWSVLAPFLFLSLTGLTLFSIWGITALVVTWFPFGLALLTRYALRT